MTAAQCVQIAQLKVLQARDLYTDVYREAIAPAPWCEKNFRRFYKS